MFRLMSLVIVFAIVIPALAGTRTEKQRAVQLFLRDPKVSKRLEQTSQIPGLHRDSITSILVSGICNRTECSHDYLVVASFSSAEANVQPNSVSAVVTFPEPSSPQPPGVFLVGFTVDGGGR
jgi:hypothetical protein